MGFNEAQTKAICHKNGPAMVLAGPGSGKTLVITRRVEYLIKKYGVRPEQILVITFTKAAAKEMRERFARIPKDDRFPVTFGTFHGIYYGILKWAYPDECIKYFFGGRKDDAFKGSYCRDGIGDRR